MIAVATDGMRRCQKYDKIHIRWHSNHETPLGSACQELELLWMDNIACLHGRSCHGAGGWGEGKSIYWSVWKLHSSMLLMRRSFSLNTTMTCIKAIHHSTRWPISPPVTGREEFFGVYVSTYVQMCACVCIFECVCNEGWFSTPGEAREVWGWPSLAVGEKYHLSGGEVIGCLRLSFWLIVDGNSKFT